MERNVKFYKCPICGNVIGLISGDAKHMSCCGKEMQELKPNTVDAAQEKHVPVYTVVGDFIDVKVGEVEHPMQEDHYIMWIAQVSDRQTTRVRLKPGEKPECRLQYIPNSEIYAYCDKHGLWMTEVK